MKIAELPTEEYIFPGNRSCAGCGAALAYRHALKALGPKTVVAIPAGCVTVIHGMYPRTSVNVPVIHTAFETTAACASGVVAGLEIQGRDDITVVGWSGDGGTVDIGIQALSGAAERNTNFIHVCYDNEAYMNTGTQRSGATPSGVRTSTTPGGGKVEHKKDMIMIMAAHRIPYIATACAAYPLDLYKKFVKARGIHGTKYIHILCPCPPGWGYEPEDTIAVGQAAVRSGMFNLFEIEEGKLRFSAPSRREPTYEIESYLEGQKRFRQFSGEQIEELRHWARDYRRQLSAMPN
ncbi:MAG: pyruvate synthase subunit beta [Planctomycetota bacterium]|nr:MAG: pyruvate synthase subunit beta [Planctomycetota bacterium]